MEKLFLFCFGLSMIVFTGAANYDATQLVKSSNQLTRDTFFKLVKEHPGQSFVVSVVAVFNILGLFSRYSMGNTTIAITDVLGTRNITAIKRNLKIANQRTFDGLQDNSIKYAAKIYADDEYQFCPNFKKDYLKYFKGTTGNTDFDIPEKAAKDINEWVKRQGINQIKTEDLVDASIIKKDEGFIIVNSFQLEINYSSDFNPTQLKVIDFYKSNKIKTKTLALYGTGIVKYVSLEKYDAQFISVTVNGGDFTILIALPNKINGLPTLLENIKGTNVFEEAQSAQKYVCAEIYLPLGKTATQTDLTDILKTVQNLDVLFNKECAEFTGVTKNCKPGVINSILSEVLVIDKIVEDGKSNQTNSKLAKNICQEKDIITIEINHPYTYSILNNAVKLYPQPIIMSGIHYA